jgi:hypothetical protein
MTFIAKIALFILLLSEIVKIEGLEIININDNDNNNDNNDIHNKCKIQILNKYKNSRLYQCILNNFENCHYINGYYDYINKKSRCIKYYKYNKIYEYNNIYLFELIYIMNFSLSLSSLLSSYETSYASILSSLL